MSEVKRYTFDEICESGDFNHEEEFVLHSDYEKLQKRLDILERAKRIWERKNGDASDLNDASQEAQHYNWLDEQNQKLEAQLERAEEALMYECYAGKRAREYFKEKEQK